MLWANLAENNGVVSLQGELFWKKDVTIFVSRGVPEYQWL